MPSPITTALAASATTPIFGRAAIHNAKPEVSIAITSEAIVLGTSYARGMGSENASMPMKCIDQIPPPIATAPPPSQRRADERFAFDTRTARLSAVYETRIATITERLTSHGLYVPVISAPFGHPHGVFLLSGWPCPAHGAGL